MPNRKPYPPVLATRSGASVGPYLTLAPPDVGQRVHDPH